MKHKILQLKDLSDGQIEYFHELKSKISYLIFNEFIEKNVRFDVGVSVIAIVLADALVNAKIFFEDLDGVTHQDYIDQTLSNIRKNIESRMGKDDE